MPIDGDRAVTLIRYSNEAYYAYATDAQLRTYQNLDGTYQENRDKGHWLSRNGYTLIEAAGATTPADRFFGVIGVDGDAVVVAFRGTTPNLGDLVIDLYGAEIDLLDNTWSPMSEWSVGGRAVWVHRNFLAKYLTMTTSVRLTVQKLFMGNKKLTRLFVTGHSLGGALATLCALDLAALRRTNPTVPEPHLYTFGSPRVGDLQLATAVAASVPESYRIHAVGDWITDVPHMGNTPAWMAWYDRGRQGTEPDPPGANYHHAGTDVPVVTTSWFGITHWLTNYHQGAVSLRAASRPVNTRWPALRDLELTKLLVRITTDTRLGSETDSDVYVTLHGVRWGPLNRTAGDFDAGVTSEYDLFALFPALVPKDPLCRRLTSVGLSLGDGPNPHFGTSAVDWRPASLEIIVNDGFRLGTWPLDATFTWADRGIVWAIPEPT